MKNAFVNRDEIAQKLADELKLTRTRCKKDILLLETIVLDHLKRKGRVRIANFGTFYLHLSKSHHIVQIRSKSRRLLLEQTLLKFKAATEFKKLLNGEKVQEKVNPPDTLQERTEKPEQEKTKEPEQILKNPEPTPRVQAPASAPPPPLPSPNAPGPKVLTLDQTVAGRTFGAIFKSVRSAGHKNVSFILSDEPQVTLFIGRPQRTLAQVPLGLVRDFLKDYFELAKYDLPQFRFVKLSTNSKMKIGYLVEAHTMPTIEGASVNLKMVG